MMAPFLTTRRARPRPISLVALAFACGACTPASPQTQPFAAVTSIGGTAAPPVTATTALAGRQGAAAGAIAGGSSPQSTASSVAGSTAAAQPTAGAGSSSPSIGTAGTGAIAGPPETASSNWVSYGNGPRNWFNQTAETKISVTTAPMLTVKWMIDLPGSTTGAPSVVGDRLFVTTGSATLALKTEDGSQIWSKPVGTTSAPAYDEETKTVFVLSGNGTLYALSADSGDTKWMKPVTTQSAANGWGSPVVVGKYVAASIGAFDVPGTFKGGIAAFDKVSGMQVAHYLHCTTVGASVWSGPGGDAATSTVYATTGNNYGQADDRSDSIFAVDLMAPDKALWSYQATKGDIFTLSAAGSSPDHDFGTNPILFELGGKPMIAAGQKAGVFHVLDRMTGQMIWTHKASMRTSAANGGILNNGAFDGQRFIIAVNEGGSPGNVMALDAAPESTKRVVWSQPLDALSWAPIGVANGVCFVPAGQKMLVLNCATGDTLHAPFMVPGTIGCGAAISDGRVYFGAGFSYGGVTQGRALVKLGLP